MKKVSDLPVHSLIGGMTSDYFDFWCQECGEHINRLKYYGEDIVGVRLQAICSKCNREFIFKIKVSPPLVPSSH
jgi:predicted SprT family Zn-dependent metalloprotease